MPVPATTAKHAPEELLHVPKHRAHNLHHAIQVIRDGPPLLVHAIHAPELAKHLGVELLQHDRVDLELLAPRERRSEHLGRVSDDEVARAEELDEDDRRARVGRRRERDAPERDGGGRGRGGGVGLGEYGGELGLGRPGRWVSVPLSRHAGGAR